MENSLLSPFSDPPPNENRERERGRRPYANKWQHDTYIGTYIEMKAIKPKHKYHQIFKKFQISDSEKKNDINDHSGSPCMAHTKHESTNNRQIQLKKENTIEKYCVL